MCRLRPKRRCACRCLCSRSAVPSVVPIFRSRFQSIKHQAIVGHQPIRSWMRMKRAPAKSIRPASSFRYPKQHELIKIYFYNLFQTDPGTDRQSSSFKNRTGIPFINRTDHLQRCHPCTGRKAMKPQIKPHLPEKRRAAQVHVQRMGKSDVGRKFAEWAARPIGQLSQPIFALSAPCRRKQPITSFPVQPAVFKSSRGKGNERTNQLIRAKSGERHSHRLSEKPRFRQGMKMGGNKDPGFFSFVKAGIEGGGKRVPGNGFRPCLPDRHRFKSGQPKESSSLLQAYTAEQPDRFNSMSQIT